MQHGWTTDIEILAEAQSVLDRFFWDVFPATFTRRIEVPSSQGLYMFSSIIEINNADGRHIFRHPFYIGESQNLTIKKRFERHTKGLSGEKWKRFMVETLHFLMQKLIRSFITRLLIGKIFLLEHSDLYKI